MNESARMKKAFHKAREKYASGKRFPKDMRIALQRLGDFLDLVAVLWVDDDKKDPPDGHDFTMATWAAYRVEERIVELLGTPLLVYLEERWAQWLGLPADRADIDPRELWWVEDLYQYMLELITMNRSYRIGCDEDIAVRGAAYDAGRKLCRRTPARWKKELHRAGEIVAAWAAWAERDWTPPCYSWEQIVEIPTWLHALRRAAPRYDFDRPSRFVSAGAVYELPFLAESVSI